MTGRRAPAPHSEASVLVVDDDHSQRTLLQSFLSAHGFRVCSAESAEDALELIESESVALVVTDVRMAGLSGLDMLHVLRERQLELPVLLVTAYADIRDAVGAMRDGAVNYLEKPIDLDELLGSVRNALGVPSPSADSSTERIELPAGVVAESTAMRRVFHEATLVAPSDVRVLITGESGAGKEVVADFIHAHSPRAKGPLVKVNCAAIPESLLESELFGHEKGAFTGATAQRMGRFEDAHEGTILLDEIAEMSPGLQAKLLRITQDGSFQRVGSNETRRADARLLASTNRDLEVEVAAGRFREDLYFRLNVIEIHVPPLRERREDILPLAHLYASRMSGGQPRFSPALSTCLSSYEWPGNVRELRNAMERARLMARGELILPEHLPARVQAACAPESDDAAPARGTRMEEMERSLILQTLRENNWSRTETARTLGISRRALLYKLRRFKDQGFSIDPD